MSKFNLGVLIQPALWLFVLGCSTRESGEINMNQILKVTREETSRDLWPRISELKVFFGHQSVGRDILNGVQANLTDMDGMELEIREFRNPTRMTKGLLLHAPIGRNGTAESKIDDFVKLMCGEMGESVDVAMMKLCFVDISGTDDADKLFEYYISGMQRIRSRRPQLTLVHCTVPITAGESRAKSFVKNILGKSTVGDANYLRNRYNRLLIQHFGTTEPVFDIAGRQALHENGTVESFHYKGGKYLCFRPDLTDDGGHPNADGSALLGEELLNVLAGPAYIAAVSTKTGAESK